MYGVLEGIVNGMMLLAFTALLAVTVYVWVNYERTFTVEPVHECVIVLDWPPRHECRVVGIKFVGK